MAAHCHFQTPTIGRKWIRMYMHTGGSFCTTVHRADYICLEDLPTLIQQFDQWRAND